MPSSRALATSSGRSALALLAAATLLGPVVAEAATFQVTATGWTSLDGGTTQVPFDLVEVTNPNGSRSVSGDGVSSAGTISEITHYGAGSLSAFAGPGTLKVKVDAVGFIDALPFYEPRVTAIAGAQMTDGVLVTSSTLPAGAIADYTVTLSVDISHNSPIYYKPEGFPHGTFDLSLYYGTSGGTNLHLPVDFGGPSASWPVGSVVSFTQTFTGQAPVGSSVPLYLSIGAAAREWVRTGDAHIYQTHIDASNTIRLFVDANTPGVELVSESGHDYSTNAVPEPSVVGLAAAGLIALCARRSRR